jgi:hypothetical protein
VKFSDVPGLSEKLAKKEELKRQSGKQCIDEFSWEEVERAFAETWGESEEYEKWIKS